jgi:hypothetical protein
MTDSCPARQTDGAAVSACRRPTESVVFVSEDRQAVRENIGRKAG